MQDLTRYSLVTTSTVVLVTRILLCRIHSVIRISLITGTTPDKYNMLYEMSRIPDETVISVRAR